MQDRYNYATAKLVDGNKGTLSVKGKTSFTSTDLLKMFTDLEITNEVNSDGIKFFKNKKHDIPTFGRIHGNKIILDKTFTSFKELHKAYQNLNHYIYALLLNVERDYYGYHSICQARIDLLNANGGLLNQNPFC